MVQCKLCKKSGLFLAVNKQGVCQECIAKLNQEKNERFKIINYSAKRVKEPIWIGQRLSNIRTVLEHVEVIRTYEQFGIPIDKAALLKLESAGKNCYDQLIIEYLKNEYNDIIPLLNTPSLTTRSKLTKLTKVLTEARKYQRDMFKPELITPLIDKTDEIIHKVQLNAIITDAEKAEFKGSKKKAMDKYMDALYFLRTDKIDDSLQQNEINKLESKIDELKEK